MQLAEGLNKNRDNTNSMDNREVSRGDRLIELACEGIEDDFNKIGTSRDHFITHAFPSENLAGIIQRNGLETLKQLAEKGIVSQVGSDAPYDHQVSVSVGQILTGYSSRNEQGRSYASSHMPEGLALVFPREEWARVEDDEYERNRILSGTYTADDISSRRSLSEMKEADELKKGTIPGSKDYKRILLEQYKVDPKDERAIFVLDRKNYHNSHDNRTQAMVDEIGFKYEVKARKEFEKQTDLLKTSILDLLNKLEEKYNFNFLVHSIDFLDNHKKKDINKDIIQEINTKEYRIDRKIEYIKNQQKEYDEFMKVNQDILTQAENKHLGKVKFWQSKKLTSEEDKILSQYNELSNGLNINYSVIEESQHEIADLKLIKEEINGYFQKIDETRELANIKISNAKKGRERRRVSLRDRRSTDDKESYWDRSKLKFTHGFMLIPKGQESLAQDLIKEKPGLDTRVLIYDPDIFFSANVVFQDLNRTRDGIEYIKSLLRGDKSSIQIDGLHQLEV